ncbi:hypothetical protein [Herbidospora sp. NBRC 101105]|uniref:hypothetical protein n=1 Tax=Herbidospora sp. NBRC 101105 TaxID=3032195 RepID=UPI00249FBC6C|nr:hypothetical protein [Herbidospora sp. NBRC 101105]GLX95961.1 hypothetical protein Hesp01_39110 [Herbidospora sp. NBRC 101105]
MRSVEFSTTTTLPATPGKVFDHLADPIGLLRFSMGQAKKVQAARGRELARRFAA